MSKKPFMPRGDDERRTWLKTFVAVLKDSTNGYAAKYKIDSTTIDRLDNGSQWVDVTLDNLDILRSNAQGQTGFKDQLFNGDGPILAPVAPPMKKDPSVPLTSGVFVFAGKVASQIKKAPDYEVADGEVLGIEGPEQNLPDPTTTAPQITVRPASGGTNEILWKKGMFDAVRLEVDRGDGWKFLAIDSVPNYVDTEKPPVGQSALYKYRAIYILNDAIYGQWSAVAQVAAQG